MDRLAETDNPTHMRRVLPLFLLVALALLVGCSKAERRRVNNVLHEIDDFHVAVAKAAFSTGAAVGSFVATTSTHTTTTSTHTCETRSYVVNPVATKEMEDKARVLYFIEGYYANNANRLTFPFDVTVRDFKIVNSYDISLQWWVTITTADAEVVFKAMAAEKDRLRDALAGRGYDYPRGIEMVVDILQGDGSKLQSSYRIRW